jgi:POT family proton-dependent oligopeptide transporter
MVGQLYPENSPLKDSAYTIFYMGINVGAMFGTLLCGYLGEKIGWHYGFGAAGVFMFLGVIIFYFFKSMLGEIGKKPSRNLENKEKTTNEPLSSVERSRVGVIFILSFFSIMFWMAFEQAGSSFSLFALNYTDRNLPMFDFIVPASWFQSLNSLFVIVFAPIVSIIWIKVAEMNIYLSSPRKFAIGLALLSVGCWIMVFGSLSIAQNQNTAQVSMLFLFFAILLHTLGELCLSPVGLSSVNKLAPKKMISIMFGVWFFASAMGNYLSGYIGGLIEELSKQWSMSGFFMMTALATSFSAALLFILSPFIQKMMHERA